MVVVVVARGQEGPGERRGWLEVVAQLTDCAVTPELPQSSLTRHRTRTPSPPGKVSLGRRRGSGCYYRPHHHHYDLVYFLTKAGVV